MLRKYYYNESQVEKNLYRSSIQLSNYFNLISKNCLASGEYRF